MNTAKEYRGRNLVNHIRNAIMGAGHVKSDGDRKAYFVFRGYEFCASSRLHVVECGFGRDMDTGRAETETTARLTLTLKKAAGADVEIPLETPIVATAPAMANA